MDSNQILFLAINILGGTAVILSYILGFKSSKGSNLLWGGISKNFQKIYTLSMIVSAIGYFIFSSYIFKILAVNVNYSFFYYAYLILLVTSALWLPLVNMMNKKKNALLWISIRATLILTAFSFFFILVLFLSIVPNGIHYYLSVAGLIIITLHTGVLDAILWPHFYTSSKK